MIVLSLYLVCCTCKYTTNNYNVKTISEALLIDQSWQCRVYYKRQRESCLVNVAECGQIYCACAWSGEQHTCSWGWETRIWGNYERLWHSLRGTSASEQRLLLYRLSSNTCKLLYCVNCVQEFQWSARLKIVVQYRATNSDKKVASTQWWVLQEKEKLNIFLISVF